MPTYVPIWGCNLGDTLWVTPLTRYIPDVVVRMLSHDARSRATAPILERLPCTVEMVPTTDETPKAGGEIHVTQRILTAYGHGGKPSIPRVLLRADEIHWALEYLHSLQINPTRAIAFTNHNSGTGDPTNQRAFYVRPPTDVIQTLARFWRAAGYTVVQFGPAPTYHDKDPFSPIEGAIHVRGLSVRQLAACYHVIGRFIGGDSGDYHLMLAVGGKVGCLVPEHSESWGYRHWDLLYSPICWGDEKPRVRYALHRDWSAFMSTRLFSFL